MCGGGGGGERGGPAEEGEDAEGLLAERINCVGGGASAGARPSPPPHPPPPISHAGQLEFESRKDLVAIFGGVVRVEDPRGGGCPGRDYMMAHQDLLDALFSG